MDHLQPEDCRGTQSTKNPDALRDIKAEQQGKKPTDIATIGSENNCTEFWWKASHSKLGVIRHFVDTEFGLEHFIQFNSDVYKYIL